MSFKIDALFEGKFLTISIISSLDTDLKKNFHHHSFPLLTYRFLRFQKIEIHPPEGDICKIGITVFLC